MGLDCKNVVLKVVHYYEHDKTYGCDVLEADRGLEWGDAVSIDIRYALHGAEGWAMPPEEFIGKCVRFDRLWASEYMGRGSVAIVPMKDEWLPEQEEL